VTGRPAEPDELAHQRAEQVAALGGGVDGDHLEDVAGPGAGRHQRVALEGPDQVVGPLLEGEPLRLDEGAGPRPVGAAQELHHHARPPTTGRGGAQPRDGRSGAPSPAAQVVRTTLVISGGDPSRMGGPQ
jgi:hypothetical protein